MEKVPYMHRANKKTRLATAAKILLLLWPPETSSREANQSAEKGIRSTLHTVGIRQKVWVGIPFPTRATSDTSIRATKVSNATLLKEGFLRSTLRTERTPMMFNVRTF